MTYVYSLVKQNFLGIEKQDGKVGESMQTFGNTFDIGPHIFLLKKRNTQLNVS